MVVEYEKERSAPYDIVILSRPDLWFHSSFNQTDELQQALYRASIGMVSHNADYWFILPRDFWPLEDKRTKAKDGLHGIFVSVCLFMIFGQRAVLAGRTPLP